MHFNPAHGERICGLLEAEADGTPPQLKDVAGGPRGSLGARPCRGCRSRPAAGAALGNCAGSNRSTGNGGCHTARGGEAASWEIVQGSGVKSCFFCLLAAQKAQKHWFDIKQLLRNFRKAKSQVKHKTKANLSVQSKDSIWSKPKNLVSILSLYFLRTLSGVRWKSPKTSA